MARRRNKQDSKNTVYRGPITRSKSSQLYSKPINLNSEDEFPILKQLGLYAVDIEGDGNCLFRALSDQYYGDGGRGSRHQEIRANVCEYMKQNRQQFEPFLDETESFDDRMRRMEEDAVYGDNTEIVAFAQRYETNVHIYQADQMYVVSCNVKNAGECHIAYHIWEHYSSVRNSDGPHSGKPNVRAVSSGEADTASSKLAAESKGSSALGNVPQWKYDVIVKSLPYAVPASQTQHVVDVILNNQGDISRSVEQLLEEDPKIIAEIEEKEEETPSFPTSADGPETKLKCPNGGAVKETNTISKEKRPKRLSAREKKERQKRQAVERKKSSVVASSAPLPPQVNAVTI